MAKGELMNKPKASLVVVLVVLLFSITQNATPIGAALSPAKAASSANQVPDPLFPAAYDTARYNVTLWIRDWKGRANFSDVNVTIFDLERRISTSNLSINETGHIDMRFLYAGSYIVAVQKDNRTVGCQEIDVTKNQTHVIRTWAYDLNMTLVDENGKPLANHTVTLYDQMVFKAPNYTMMADAVGRRQNYTVVTDWVGIPFAQTETNKNGTLSFADVWNGTYRLGIVGKEMWVEEYILGEHVLTRREPAVGEYILDLQNPANITLKLTRVDLRLRFVSESGVSVRNATIYIRNMQDHLFFKELTNKTGFVEKKNVYVIDGLYNVTAQHDNRTLGHEIIKVSKTEVFTVKCWAYNLTVRCVDQDYQPLSNYVVFLYDQVIFYSPTNITTVRNQTGLMVNWTRTNVNGTAYFKDIWNGTYWIRVMGSEEVGEQILSLQEQRFITIVCNKTYMTMGFETLSGEPLTEATVTVFDDAGNLVFRDRTDENGFVLRKGLRSGNYTVNVEWMGTQVWSGIVNIYRDRYRIMRCSVYRLTIYCVDTFGNILPKADLTLEKMITRWEKYVILYSETDERGSISLLLPYGSYEVSCTYGIYAGSLLVDLNDDRTVTLNCNVRSVLWASMVAVALPLAVFSLLLERRRLRTPLEIRRYKNMLFELESMYKNGLVEYRIYRKLREEYEAKLIELGGREMR